MYTVYTHVYPYTCIYIYIYSVYTYTFCTHTYSITYHCMSMNIVLAPEIGYRTTAKNKDDSIQKANVGRMDQEKSKF